MKAWTEGGDCPCAGSTQPTACHTASSTPETGKQFLAAPVPQTGQVPSEIWWADFPLLLLTHI